MGGGDREEVRRKGEARPRLHMRNVSKKRPFVTHFDLNPRGLRSSASVSSLPTVEVDAAANEVERAMRDLGLPGAKFLIDTEEERIIESSSAAFLMDCI